MEAGIAIEAALRAEMERVQSTLRESAASRRISSRSRRATRCWPPRSASSAKLFAAKNPDMIEILRLQAEIRWFAPDAYASGAAFEYAVGFGQARRSAGADAAQAAGRRRRAQADVLADLAANWAREQSRPGAACDRRSSPRLPPRSSACSARTRTARRPTR